MPSLPILIGTVVAVGLALTVGVACRARSCASSTPEPVELRSVLQDTNSGVQEQRLVVVRDDEAWGALWSEHAALQIPNAPVPELDFDEEMAIVLFLGSRPTGGHAVTIEWVERGPSGLVVHAVATAPAADAMTTQALTAPMHAVAVPRCTGEVTLDLRASD
jgi:hypothetical protein